MQAAVISTYITKQQHIVSCGVRDKIKEEHLTLSSMDFEKATKGLIALTPSGVSTIN
jgi:hypothetical protein